MVALWDGHNFDGYGGTKVRADSLEVWALRRNAAS